MWLFQLLNLISNINTCLLYSMFVRKKKKESKYIPLFYFYQTNIPCSIFTKHMMADADGKIPSERELFNHGQIIRKFRGIS